MTDPDPILDELADQGDGAIAVPLLHKDGAFVVATLDGNEIIGTPLFVRGDTTRAATMQEIHDARIDRPIDRGVCS